MAVTRVVTVSSDCYCSIHRTKIEHIQNNCLIFLYFCKLFLLSVFNEATNDAGYLETGDGRNKDSKYGVTGVLVSL